MGKFLSWVGIAALVWLAFRLFAILGRKRALGERTGNAPRGGSEPMLQCARCGVFVPSSEALVDGKRAWCCAAHRDADRDASRDASRNGTGRG